MKRTLAAVAAAAVLVTGGQAIASAGSGGASPRRVDLRVPCQTVDSLNCSWYGQPATRLGEVDPITAFQINWKYPKGVHGGKYCTHYLVPVRVTRCAHHWPLPVK